MKQITFSKHHKFYTSILLALTVSITVTILVLSSILYINFENISLSLIHTFIKDNLSQVSYSATLMSNSSKSLALQMYFDPDITKLLRLSSVETNDMLASIKKIDSYRNTNPLTHSIYLYNRKAGKFYTTLLDNESKEQASFYDKEIIHILSNFNEYKHMIVIPRKILDPYKKYKEDKSANVYTLVFSDSASSNNSLEEAVILNISEKWLRNIIDSLGSNPESNTFIIDRTGKTMISSEKYPLLKDLSEEKYIKRILTDKKPSGYFINNIDGAKSLVTYASYSSMNWIFISITPYNLIVSRINNMKFITLLSALLILMFGLLLSFLLSRKLYKPIDSMADKLRLLEEEKRENLYEQKQSLLRAVLQGDLEVNLERNIDRFGKFNIKLNPSAQFLIILLKIDHFSDFCNKYTLKDRNLFKFSIMNVASEICSGHFANESIDTGENLMVLLLNVSGPVHQENRQLLDELAKNIQFSVEKYLQISVSITIGSTGDTIKAVVGLYTECVEASLYRIFHGHKCIIYSEDKKLFISNDYNYPVQKEKLLVEALMLGKLTDVKKIYTEITGSTVHHQFAVFQSTVSHLASAINTAVDSLLKNSRSAMLYNFTTFIVEVSKLETLDEINSYFFEAFEKIISEVEKKKSSKYDELLEAIIEIVNKEYSNPNLSIETLADSVGMSPVYLGRLFKKLTTKSVSDYITEIRMEKAKHLIKSTDLSITEILDKTGFVSSGYFYTLFKKMHGITPNEYRQKH